MACERLCALITRPIANTARDAVSADQKLVGYIQQHPRPSIQKVTQFRRRFLSTLSMGPLWVRWMCSWRVNEHTHILSVLRNVGCRVSPLTEDRCLRSKQEQSDYISSMVEATEYIAYGRQHGWQ